MATDIVKRREYASLDLMGDGFERVERMATGLAKSGMFKDTNAGQALAKILIGADMGLTPTQALMTIDLVRGNVQIRGKRLLAWVRQSDGYDYEVIERSPERGTIRFFEKSKRTGEWKPCEPDITFTLEDAKKKDLVKTGGGWDKWPESMCLWRCASIGVNLFAPDLVGGVPVYTEADDFTESTAVEIGAGEGSGAEPGWEGLSDEQIAEVEAVLSVAETLAPGTLDRASVQMRLNGRPDAVEPWVADTKDMLAKRAEPVGEGEQQTLGAES
jgi:hypothetical protein